MVLLSSVVGFVIVSLNFGELFVVVFRRLLLILLVLPMRIAGRNGGGAGKTASGPVREGCDGQIAGGGRIVAIRAIVSETAAVVVIVVGFVLVVGSLDAVSVVLVASTADWCCRRGFDLGVSGRR